MLSNLFSNLFAAWKVDIQVGLKTNVFYPGNIIEGVVVIKTTSPINFTAIRLKITGKEKVICRRQERRGNNTRTVTYSASYTVIKQLITLAGDMKYMPMMRGKGGYQLPPGHYAYPFAFQLPFDLPPSFRKQISDDFASIMYYVKAYVDIPNGRDAVSKAFFSIIRPIPQTQWLMKHPLAVDRGFQVTLCCCIDKGIVNAHVSMDRSVIAMDRDWLQVFAAIDNTRGKEPVLNLEISLRHTLTYIARHVRETNSYTAGKRFIGTSIPAGQKGIITGVIDLPRNLIPSFMTPNVQSRYMISIELNIPWATDPCVTFPVFIAQSVDHSNVTPPVSFDAVGQTHFTAGRQPCVEYYYAPPPQPVHMCQPAMGFQPPPGANYMPPPVPQTQLALPSRQWTEGNPPPANEGAPNNVQFQWQPGYFQAVAEHFDMAPPPKEPPMIDINAAGSNTLTMVPNSAVAGGGASPDHGSMHSPMLAKSDVGGGDVAMTQMASSTNGGGYSPANNNQSQQQQYPQQYPPQQQQYGQYPYQQQQAQQGYGAPPPQQQAQYPPQQGYGAPPPQQQQQQQHPPPPPAQPATVGGYAMPTYGGAPQQQQQQPPPQGYGTPPSLTQNDSYNL